MADAKSPSKRPKIAVESKKSEYTETTSTETVVVRERVRPLLDRPISPPASRRKGSTTPNVKETGIPVEADSEAGPNEERSGLKRNRANIKANYSFSNSKDTIPNRKEDDRAAKPSGSKAKEPQSKAGGCTYIPSPVQLTWIKSLPPDQNVDAVKLTDILRDPMIKECWQFNYLFDLEFLMNALDPDTKHLVQIKIVHGSWKREDPQRIELEELSAIHPNVQIITAYMPEAFGTHHSKMMILIRHDDTAQVIIHTANMIPRDWGNMTQAIPAQNQKTKRQRVPKTPTTQTKP